MPDSREQYAERLLTAVNAAAAAVSSRFVTFVTVGAYVAVTVASTTHEMLLRASNLVTLPILNAQIPIVGPFGFFSIAPWLIVLLHADLLLQLSILSGEIRRLDQETASLPEEPRSMLRERQANFYYVLYLTGLAPTRFLHLLSAFITWVTAVVLPLGLLFFIQVRFLPFHSALYTWLHRAAILADVALILLILMPHLWSRRKSTASPGAMGTLQRAASVPMLILLACVGVVVLSMFVATIPREAGRRGVAWFSQNMQLRERVLTANALSPEDINELRDSNSARLPDVLSKVTPYQALQGRDFRFADLYNAVLPKLDLRAVRPEGRAADLLPPDCESRRGCVDPPECDDASLVRTRLAGANFGWASMQQAMFDDAILDEADLSWAKVQYGSFSRARLNGARLESAQLAFARFDNAKVCGADLRGASMPGASLVGAHLRGAVLRDANLTKANLQGADLRGADLSGANLSGAVLKGALLGGALMRGAVMDGVALDGADVELSDLRATRSDAGDERETLVAYLVRLACEDAPTARGIAMQALTSPGRDGVGLARALLEAQQGAGCEGLRTIAPKPGAELRKRATSLPEPRP